MTLRVRPADRQATPADLALARARESLVRSELPRVRTAAVAWRNGLAGLLVGLLGFSLVKGRSDVSQLASGWALTVGALLALALVCGGFGALRLMRAGHGLPTVTPVSRLRPQLLADHEEALRAARDLRWGIRATLCCAGLLVIAVGATWYGPAAADPALRITTPAGTECATRLTLGPSGGALTTKEGSVPLPSGESVTVRPGGTACEQAG
ncbi:hypothetical protein [Streptomyces sp. NBC_00670]|jgi:hypothetical protein|uniref:hypothetical protein n=1 Tax=Streptomyces sp. NBC_00670 TaxID=2975804 RepID=UPI002E318D04|nr:hypothetical protein [Streptomyces sp. NBC_00670]